MRDKKRFTHPIRIHEMDSNQSWRVWYTQRGAKLWDWLARRGFVALIWDEYSPAGGYYYHEARLRDGLQKAWDEGLIKRGGMYYDEDPAFWCHNKSFKTPTP